MATTPSWVVQSSPTSGSKQPAWVVSNTPTTTPKAPAFDPSKEGKYEGAFDYLNGNIDASSIQNQGQWVGGEGGSYQDNFVDTRDHGIFKDAVSMTGRDYGGEDAIGHGPGYQLDYTKLPNNGMTKFGRIDQVYQVKGLDDVLNPNAVIWDDNYGWVTSRANRKPRFADKVGPGVASLAMGGLMGVALPAGLAGGLVKTGMGIAPSISQGKFDPVSIGMSLAGNIGGSMGLPGWVVPTAKTAYGVATQGFNPTMLANMALGYGANALGLPSWVVPAVKTGMSLSQMYNQGRG